MTPADRARQEMPEALCDLVQAPIRWQVVKTAFELKLFDQLTPPDGAAGIAERLGLHPVRTGLVLDALAALSLIRKRSDRYSLSADHAPYLTSTGACYLGDLLLSMSALRHAGLGTMPEMLRADFNQPIPPALRLDDAARWEKSVASLRAYHRTLSLPRAIAVLERLPEWPNVRRFLDLGAGSEVLGRHLAETRPDVETVLFDLPPSAALIRQALSGLTRGPTVVGGDFNRDDFGAGYDVIWCSMALYYARPDIVHLLERIRLGLSPRGVFVSCHEGLSDERTKPEPHVIGRLMPALRGQDLSFNQNEIAEAMKRAGFRSVETARYESPFGIIEVDIARG